MELKASLELLELGSGEFSPQFSPQFSQSYEQ